MSTQKDVLCLLAILVAYGIAGRIDYGDAVMLEEARQSAAPVDCPTGKTLTVNDPEVQTNDLAFDPRTNSADAATPEGDVPCVLISI
ncbi:MAG: hypothetical protein Q7U73_11190 [Rubrivivax sp.]|nr:hypothetical protein [Rubrivivax sp.]